MTLENLFRELAKRTAQEYLECKQPDNQELLKAVYQLCDDMADFVAAEAAKQRESGTAEVADARGQIRLAG